MLRTGSAMNRNVKWPNDYSDEASAHKGTTDIYAPAVSHSGATAKGNGGPRPATYITSKAACDAEWCKPL